jgi:drug/metabolite transporter (DMT)-like permease
MGAASLVLLAAAWRPAVPPVGTYLLPLIGTAGFYLAGQVGLFFMVRSTAASRVAPLLGFKIFVIAILSVVILGQSLTLAQWAAVGLCAAATLLLNYSGDPLPWQAAGWLGLACLGYSLSDLCIVVLVNRLAPLSRLHASVYGVAASYVLCGVAAAALLPLVRGRRLAGWRYAVPFSVFWFCAMVLLFACFSATGAVFGNVLQSTRGLMSIGLGLLVAKRGWRELEDSPTGARLIRRIGGAVLMIAAIALFAGSR